MKSKFEIGLLESESIIKKSGLALINNVGKTVAVITVLLAILITFTDVCFTDFASESFTCTLLMLIIASYLMYFSLEEAGEKCAEESDEYKDIIKLYNEEREKIKGEEIDSFRDFCLNYSREELQYRKKNYIISHALPPQDFENYLNGQKFPQKTERIFRKAERMRAIQLTPRMLLTKERALKKSELKNPEKFKLMRLFMHLIPTTVCMTVTVSVMLTAKEGLTAATVIEGILKLSTLPIVGLKGYANGYSYIMNSYIPWMETKKRLLEAYNEKKVRY